jgi:hypothetical protein
MKGFNLIDENETHQFLCPFHDPKYDLFSYFSHERHHVLILLFHGVKTSPFSLLV